MLSTTIKLDIPKDIFIALNETETDLQNEIKIFTAIKFYQLRKLTIGKASELAGISRYEFEKILSKNKIPISNLTIRDIEKDINKLKNL